MSTSLSGVNWIKSSYSHHGGECVEVAHLSGGLVGVRDSKNPSGPALVFEPGEWDAFSLSVKNGKLNGHNV